MTLHSAIALGENHALHNWEFDDAALRDAHTYSAADVGKEAKLADETFWRVVSVSDGVATFREVAGGGATTASVGALISGATSKVEPVDADQFGLSDSAAGGVLKKLSWLNLKLTLKAYFDPIYRAAGTAINDVLTGFSVGSGTVSASDSILQAIQKIVGNLANYALLSGATFTGAVIMSDQLLSRANFVDCAVKVNAKGSINSTSTVTFDHTDGCIQSLTCGGAYTLTWAFSNWPATSYGSYIRVDVDNMGLGTLAFAGVVNWKLKNDAYTTSFSTYLADRGGETTLKTSGLDSFMFWQKDGGTTIYGVLL